MKFAKTTLILATLLFAMPVLAKDKLKKEKKRFTKEIRENKKAKAKSSTYKVRSSKFHGRTF